jgi:hypothetical protein
MQDQQRTCGRPTVSSVRYCTRRSRGVLPTDSTLVPYCMMGARHSPRVPRFHVAPVLFPVLSHTCQILLPAGRLLDSKLRRDLQHCTAYDDDIIPLCRFCGCMSYVTAHSIRFVLDRKQIQ